MSQIELALISLALFGGDAASFPLPVAFVAGCYINCRYASLVTPLAASNVIASAFPASNSSTLGLTLDLDESGRRIERARHLACFAQNI